MNLKRVAAAAAIAAGVGMSTLTSGVALVSAAPAPGIPAEKCWRYGRSGGGSPRGGGGMPGYLPPCAGRV
jgi:hypothetical protein